MEKNERQRRVVIAVTESCPLSDLWRTAVQAAGDSPNEIVALFLDDERWQHAASLPFTREISRVGGSTADFTSDRAKQLLTDTISRMQEQIDRLASESGVAAKIVVVPDSEQERARSFISRSTSIVIASPALTDHPIYAELTRQELRVQIVEDEK